MTTEEAIAKGNEAQKLINNPILKEAFERANASALNQLIHSEHDDVDQREHQYIMMKAIKEVEQVIYGFISAGERAVIKSNLNKSNERLHNLNN